MTILRKDLKLELRTFETITVTLIFTTSTFIVFHFALNRDELFGDLAAGVFWVTILFASSLTINRLLSNERAQGGYEGLLLAPIDRNAILYAKIAYLFIALTMLEIFAILIYALMLLGTELRDPDARADPDLPAGQPRPRDDRHADQRAGNFNFRA